MSVHLGHRRDYVDGSAWRTRPGLLRFSGAPIADLHGTDNDDLASVWTGQERPNMLKRSGQVPMRGPIVHPP